MKNKKQIIPLILMLLLLTAAYAVLATGAGKGSFIQTTSIGETLPSPVADTAEDDKQICGLQEVLCEGEYPDRGLGQTATITMYNSFANQTDSSPCISADNTNICKANYNVCASNDYKFGAKIKIDKLGICIIKDRMNRRYTGKGRIDFYAGYDLQRALNFGRQKLNIIILN
mgnify:CR=1 FL=1